MTTIRLWATFRSCRRLPISLAFRTNCCPEAARRRSSANSRRRGPRHAPRSPRPARPGWPSPPSRPCTSWPARRCGHAAPRRKCAPCRAARRRAPPGTRPAACPRRPRSPYRPRRRHGSRGTPCRAGTGAAARRAGRRTSRGCAPGRRRPPGTGRRKIPRRHSWTSASPMPHTGRAHRPAQRCGSASAAEWGASGGAPGAPRRQPSHRGPPSSRPCTSRSWVCTSRRGRPAQSCPSPPGA
mmetsp:Transcript_49407/g.131229  ORF Transcript_49407/g.131229 Transcript_49407/m.131229 type:complete len:240 (+) Transcript_49407:477-1196(+)